MEEEKAAAYYDELSRKGKGAARFKQGLGFSSSSAADGNVPARGSALPPTSTSSSASLFLSKFVRASSPSKAAEIDKRAQLESIQNKLKKKPKPSSESQHQHSSEAVIDRTKEQVRDRDRHSRRRSLSPSRSPGRDRDRHSRRRSRSRDRDRHSRRRSRSRSLSRDGYHSRHRRQHRSRSRSTSRDANRDHKKERERNKERTRRRSRSLTISDEERGRKKERRSRSKTRSVSPRKRTSERSNGGASHKVSKDRNGGIDHSKLIEGYDKMTPAERVKAKMKLQLSETAEKDETKGAGWERFEFNKDAPLDDEVIEAAEDDVAIVKSLGQSFRFSAMEARREEQIKAAHDEAIFGAPVHSLSNNSTDDEYMVNSKKVESTGNDLAASLISKQVLARQQGSWRERARKM